jgi:hypothetical protein
MEGLGHALSTDENETEQETAMIATDARQVAGGFVDAVTRSAALRDQAMKNLDQAHQAQQKALTIEASRVASRYGANSPQSKAIQARVAAHAARGRVITAERQRTQIGVPSAQPDAFIVYGRVLDSTGNPKKRVKIDAHGMNGAPVASTQSGSDGVFQLRVHAEKADATAPLKAGDSPGKPDRAAATGATPAAKFQIVLTDSTSTTYRYQEIFQATGGMVAYREIVMPSAAE